MLKVEVGIWRCFSRIQFGGRSSVFKSWLILWSGECFSW